jgi:transposase
MFALSSEHRFHLYNGICDMRKGFNGLCGIVRNILLSDPCSGDVFMFVNKKRDKMKLLHWQGGGFVLYYKRLEKGTFELPRYESIQGSICIDYTKMVMIVDGISIKNLQQKERYTLPN